MAIMDITDIEPLLMAVYELLQESGIFIFMWEFKRLAKIVDI